MSALVQTDKYGAVNTTYTTTMGYYVIKLISEAYALREETTCDRKIGSAGELVVKAQYINCMKDNTKRYLYGKITTTKKYHRSNMQNFASMFGCYEINGG